MEKTKQASKSRERRLRASYRRKIRIAIVLCLIIGLVAGFMLGRLTAPKTATVTSAPNLAVNNKANPAATAVPDGDSVIVNTAATAAPTATVAPTPQPTAQPAPDAVIVPYGAAQDIVVQALPDGTARNDNGSAPYETLNFSMRVTRYLSNEYYVETHGSKYDLSKYPNTACVEFELLLKDYTGSLKIDPNALIKQVGVEMEDGTVTLGYRFNDAEINGNDQNLTMTTNVPMMLYKRFNESASASVYLTATLHVNGVPQVYKFELQPPAEPEATTAPTYATMRSGDTGDAVKALQERLIELGYLPAGSADGHYGNMTYEAVIKAQTDFNLTADGIAGPQFQAALAN